MFSSWKGESKVRSWEFKDLRRGHDLIDYQVLLTVRKLIAQKAIRTSYNGNRGLSSTVTPGGLKKYNRTPAKAIGTKVQVKHVIHPK